MSGKTIRTDEVPEKAHGRAHGLLLVYQKANGICHLCGLQVPWSEASKDHIIPRKLFKHLSELEKTILGNNNNVLAHKFCNHERGSLSVEEYKRAKGYE